MILLGSNLFCLDHDELKRFSWLLTEFCFECPPSFCQLLWFPSHHGTEAGGTLPGGVSFDGRSQTRNTLDCKHDQEITLPEHLHEIKAWYHRVPNTTGGAWSRWVFFSRLDENSSTNRSASSNVSAFCSLMNVQTSLRRHLLKSSMKISCLSLSWLLSTHCEHQQSNNYSLPLENST